MTEIKEKILQAIYLRFENWNQDNQTACQEGCAACCTQNVTVTATEAELIHKYIAQKKKSSWLAKILAVPRNSQKPTMTTNEFAHACLNGEETDPGKADNFAPCLFLTNGCCQIYEVRPFSCRAFVSTTICGPGAPASATEQYLAATTAVSQIIEHLGQKEYWGHLFDVLTVMSENPLYQETNSLLTPSHSMNCRLQTLTARPLTGFLLTEEDIGVVEPLLLSIFTTKIDDRTIEEILNSGN